MIESIQFIIKNYSTLALLILAFWGFGQTFIHCVDATCEDRLINLGLAISTGLGIFILILQLLAINGQLQRSNLNIALFSGFILVAIQAAAWWKFRSVEPSTTPVLPAKTLLSWASLILVALAFAPTLVAPLIPPKEWDELMYHLPHANQWAQTGRLTVNEWLRYPWFPYNFNLVYAAALILRGDILTHLLHACAGWLVALMVYRLGILYSNRITATIATLMWLSLAKNFFSNAYIELGIALFITASCVAFLFWLENPSKRGWLVITAFMLGLAAGSKYQTLTFLPLFFVVAIFRDRRPSSALIACTAFLFPCIYWYARNTLVTGDPFSPLGAKLFGFYDWSVQDYEWQFLDIKRVANWPEPPLWPLLLVPFLKPWLQGRALLSASMFGFYALVVWYFTSHYDRYLVPAMPVLSLLSAWALTTLGTRLITLIPKLLPWCTLKRQQQSMAAGGAIAALLIVVVSLSTASKLASQVALTPEQRTNFLRQHVVAYDLLMDLRQQPGLKIYQWGLEDAIYYAPNPMWGEVFGPWRYSDLNGLPIPALARRLSQQGFNTLLVRDNNLAPLVQQSDFTRYFQLLSPGNGAQAYRILSPTP